MIGVLNLNGYLTVEIDGQTRRFPTHGHWSKGYWDHTCDLCEIALEVLSHQPFQKYKGPDSLDFSSSRQRLQELVIANSLYTTEYRVKQVKGGRFITITIPERIPPYKEVFLLCDSCQSLKEKIRETIIKQAQIDAKHEVEEAESDLQRDEFKLRESKANLRRLQEGSRGHA